MSSESNFSIMQDWSGDDAWGYISSASSLDLYPFPQDLLLVKEPSAKFCFFGQHEEFQKIIEEFHNQDLFLQEKCENKSLDEGNQVQSSSTDDAEISNSILKSEKLDKSNSAFHNFQKHLSTALRKILEFPADSDSEDYKKVAKDIWEAFRSSKTKNRKILQLVFNQQTGKRHETLSWLKKTGLFCSNEIYSSEVINSAKKYLLQLALKNLTQDKIREYLKKSKLASHDVFVEYMLSFRKELETGRVMSRTQPGKISNF